MNRLIYLYRELQKEFQARAQAQDAQQGKIRREKRGRKQNSVAQVVSLDSRRAALRQK